MIFTFFRSFGKRKKVTADAHHPRWRRGSLPSRDIVLRCELRWEQTEGGAPNSTEIARICKPMKIDSYKVMEIFCSDEKLNISRAYLKPGFAFGGSCLPKDVRALTHKAKHLDVEVPVLSNLLRSNEIHYQQLVDNLVTLNKKKLGFLGLSFKEDTDDLRESPLVDLVEKLLGKGYEISIYDKNIEYAKV